MANKLQDAVPRILAQGLKVLREECVLAMQVNRDFDKDAAKKGDTVNVPVSLAMGEAEDVTPSSNPSGNTDVEIKTIPIVLDKWKFKKFTLTDKELSQVMEGVQVMAIEQAARSLANRIEYDLFNLYKEVWGWAGQSGQTPFQRDGGSPSDPWRNLNAASDARRVLNLQLAPQRNRHMVLDVNAEANATSLPEFLSALNSGSDRTIREGDIGRKLGFDWHMSQVVVDHVSTVAGTITTSGSSNLKNKTVLSVTGCTVAPSPGDIFRIAGDDLTYVCRENCTLTTWNIGPELRRDIPAASAITIVPTSGPQNLAFHRDAFALAVRPLMDTEPVGNIIESYVDDVSGIPLRLEISRENKQTAYCFDILYGAKAVRAEFGCRIGG